ncbi:unnamed protein product [Caenorhabditis sp. 36 PRJEB53466]|nr:unnamed protein product [Caenorhabditis sp. 36 PRJEB53466]
MKYATIVSLLLLVLIGDGSHVNPSLRDFHNHISILPRIANVLYLEAALLNGSVSATEITGQLMGKRVNEEVFKEYEQKSTVNGIEEQNALLELLESKEKSRVEEEKRNQLNDVIEMAEKIRANVSLFETVKEALVSKSPALIEKALKEAYFVDNTPIEDIYRGVKAMKENEDLLRQLKEWITVADEWKPELDKLKELRDSDVPKKLGDFLNVLNSSATSFELSSSQNDRDLIPGLPSCVDDISMIPDDVAQGWLGPRSEKLLPLLKPIHTYLEFHRNTESELNSLEKRFPKKLRSLRNELATLSTSVLSLQNNQSTIPPNDFSKNFEDFKSCVNHLNEITVGHVLADIEWAYDRVVALQNSYKPMKNIREMLAGEHTKFDELLEKDKMKIALEALEKSGFKAAMDCLSGISTDVLKKAIKVSSEKWALDYVDLMESTVETVDRMKETRRRLGRMKSASGWNGLGTDSATEHTVRTFRMTKEEVKELTDGVHAFASVVGIQEQWQKAKRKKEALNMTDLVESWRPLEEALDQFAAELSHIRLDAHNPAGRSDALARLSQLSVSLPNVSALTLLLDDLSRNDERAVLLGTTLRQLQLFVSEFESGKQHVFEKMEKALSSRTVIVECPQLRPASPLVPKDQLARKCSDEPVPVKFTRLALALNSDLLLHLFQKINSPENVQMNQFQSKSLA